MEHTLNYFFKFIFIFTVLFANYSNTEEQSQPLPGRVLGNDNAEIIIEEYASMSCGHCANFHNNTLSDIKEKYIDTGKAKLIFNDFPLDRSAMLGSMITQCMNDEQFFPVLNRLFQKQNEWTQSENILESIFLILKPLGLEQSKILACIEENDINKNRWKSLLAGREFAMKTKNVEATPTFFINGKIVNGKFNLDKLEEILK